MCFSQVTLCIGGLSEEWMFPCTLNPWGSCNLTKTQGYGSGTLQMPVTRYSQDTISFVLHKTQQILQPLHLQRIQYYHPCHPGLILYTTLLNDNLNPIIWLCNKTIPCISLKFVWTPWVICIMLLMLLKPEWIVCSEQKEIKFWLNHHLWTFNLIKISLGICQALMAKEKNSTHGNIEFRTSQTSWEKTRHWKF